MSDSMDLTLTAGWPFLDTVVWQGQTLTNSCGELTVRIVETGT